MNLNQAVCVITGAGGAVGSQLVTEFHSRGSKVVAVLHGSNLELTETEPNHFSVEGDLVDGETTRKIITSILDKFGQIDVLINTAGGFQAGKPVEETSMDQWKNMFSINFITTLNCCRNILPQMKKQGFGKIINFGSTPGEEGMAEASAYAVSKAAVHALTKSISKETKDTKIDSIVVLPETIDTPQNRAAMPDIDRSGWLKPRELAQQLAQMIEADQFEPDSPVIHLKAGEEFREEKPESILSVFDQVDVATAVVESAASENDDKNKSKTEDQPEVTTEEVLVEDSAKKPETDTEDTESNSIDVDSNMVTFSMVTHLKSRGLYQRALEVLDALLQKGGDQNRVIQEKREIEEMLGLEPIDEEKTSGEKAPLDKDETDETEKQETEIEPDTSKGDDVQEDDSEHDSILIKSELPSEQTKETAEPEASQDELVTETSDSEEIAPKSPETPAETENNSSTSSLLKSIKGISSSTLTLLIILALVSVLSIQDQINPETSLVAKFVSIVTGYYPPSGAMKKMSNNGKTVVVSGFIDTLSDQDEDSTQEQEPTVIEPQTSDLTTIAIPESAVSDVVPIDTVTTPVIVQDTVQQDTAIIAVTNKEAEQSEPTEETGDSLMNQRQEEQLEPDTIVSSELVSPDNLFTEELFHEAAQAWAEEKRVLVEHYTIVLEYVCKERTIHNAYQALQSSDEFFLLPKQINEQGCFIICLGDFKELSEAETRLKELPSWFVENGAQPSVRALIKLLK